MTDPVTGMHYVSAGSGPAVLLLHGNGEDHHIFDVLLPQLAAHCTVIAPDTPGHGLSPDPPRFDYRLLAQSIAQFIASLALPRLLLCGSSDGGILGLLLALERPELLSGLVACGANSVPEGIEEEWLEPARRQLLLNYDNRAAMCVEQPHITTAELASVKVPTWIVAGEHDLVKREHSSYLARTIPRAELIILAGEEHGSYVNYSAKLAPLLLNLVAGQSIPEEMKEG